MVNESPIKSCILSLYHDDIDLANSADPDEILLYVDESVSSLVSIVPF